MYYFWGMHWGWWFFWMFLWMLFFSFMAPMRRSTYRQMQSPLQLLQKRYASGGGSQARIMKNGGPHCCGMPIRSKGKPPR